MSLSLEKRQLYAAILAVRGIGRATLRRILHQLTALNVSLSEFWQSQSTQLWQACGLTSAQQAALRKFQQRFTPEAYLGWLHEQQIDIITYEDIRYPELLKEIDDKPFVLYIKGSVQPVKKHPIAVVGTRQVSGYGRSVIEFIVPALVAQEASIVSGFMYGVDTCAQRVALQVGGHTLGVLGCGFNRLYPVSNKSFVPKLLAAGGGLMTEYPPWVAGYKGNFRERNRIVAGLSLATVVIEAGQKSGSHITARLAGEYGRGVCAVPGPITNPYSEGTKWLVNQGARLVSSAEEILAEAGVYGVGWSREVSQKPGTAVSNQPPTCPLPVNADPEQKQILQALLAQPLDTDGLAKELKLPIPTLNYALSMLELGGWIERKDELWLPKIKPKNNSVKCLT